MTTKKKTKNVAAPGRIILFVNELMYVKGHGYRPVFVVEGEAGYRDNGTWPYEGKVGQTMPWFFGHTIKQARELVRKHNERLGVDEEEAALIVSQSMQMGPPR